MRAVMMMIGCLAGLAFAQTPRFDVASIRPFKAGGGKGGIEVLPGGRVKLEGMTLNNMIALAYDLPEERISGGPKWAGSETYNVDAKPEQPDPGAGKRSPAPGTPAWLRFQARMQALLTERFRLTFHIDEKASPVWILVPAKSGAKVQESAEAEETPPGMMRSRDAITSRAGTIAMLAVVLGNWLGRPVEDRTGLTGRYDFKLQYAPEGETSGPSVYTALEEQLGLKLENGRGTLRSMVIDRAEKPAN